MMTKSDLAMLSFIILAILILLVKNKVKEYKFKIVPANKAPNNLVRLLEEKGYKYLGYCGAKKISFYKGNTKTEESIKSLPVVKREGKYFLVESMPKNRTLSLKDSFIKAKILKAITCYNDIDGIIFVETKNKYVKECTVDIAAKTKNYLLRLVLLVLFLAVGFLIAHLLL
ncbi:hypothetical protein PRVXT_001107 [Proteinivorax tanatarense]|uniref:Uncharacterized protein n=1 Tax=Proteinivorax tanatarense TaxID=1260629 RepID=A0AAU7VQ44_9FIRM